MLGFKLSGFIAWFVWRGVYLFKLPSLSRKIQVGFDWAWLLIFPRDLSCIKTDVTDRVSHAHYEPGDYIVKQGEPPSGFFVIEQGEVEIVRMLPDKPAGEVIATLGTGNFFGEQALINNQPRDASVRARTPVEVVVMGRNVFTTISKSLAPLKQALTAAITRRSSAAWQERPAVLAALRGFKLADFIEPAPTPLLKPTESLYQVSHHFARHPSDFFFVSPDGSRLDGMITLTDLLRAQSNGVKPDTPLADFMKKDPAVLAVGDSALIAASAFREHGYKTLPVVTDMTSRRIVGVVKVRKLIAKVLDVVPPPSGMTAPPIG
jgi:NADH dehydrogenase